MGTQNKTFSKVHLYRKQVNKLQEKDDTTDDKRTTKKRDKHRGRNLRAKQVSPTTNNESSVEEEKTDSENKGFQQFRVVLTQGSTTESESDQDDMDSVQNGSSGVDHYWICNKGEFL